jgi:Ni,Fe-hydrogenase III small subunit
VTSYYIPRNPSEEDPTMTLFERLKHEPVVVVATILTVLVSFGVLAWTDVQQSAVLTAAGALIAAYTVVAAADTSASAKQNAVVVAIGAVVAVGTAFGVSLFTDAQLEAVVGVVVLVFGGTATQRQLVTPVV